ncbi:hypothetical protein AMJ51_02335 [Microgenomates bacterium DG_75]|nr:MAG: hypothetical protein AMJ51_02335 [Microgenomates bacterium DG_75]
MKTTAKAPANIAFIKYWGKKNAKLRLPLNSSIAMNLDKIFTLTTVEFLPTLKTDQIEMVGEKIKEKEASRIEAHLDRIRKLAKIKLKARVRSKNNFPKGTGIASSASGFAALSLAGTTAAGLKLSQKKLSILARLGSGSACRSIPDGFVEWRKGDSDKTSIAHSLYSPDYWQIADIVAIVTKTEKKVPSTEGHARAESSPFLIPRVARMEGKVRAVKRALKKKDFSQLGSIIEEDGIDMHAVMMTSRPPIIYWLPKTVEIILAVLRLREEGLESYFTIDAGPTVHVICQRKNSAKIRKALTKIRGIHKISVNYPSVGARLTKNHLF